MNNALKSTLIFLLGAGVGASVSALYFSKKYQKECDEMREAYNHMTERRKAVFEQPSPVELAKKYGADAIAKTYDPPKIIVEDDCEDELDDETLDEECVPIEGIDLSEARYEPYIIPPEDFGDYPSFSRIDLTFYADGVLCEDNETMTDISDKVGYDALNHFGEYEDDSVYVRNERLQADFCIIRVPEKYYDLIKHDHPTEE